MASLATIPKKPTAVEFLKLMSGPKVDVIVGKDKKHYSLPKDLLCYHSRYFDRCFNDGFKEAEEQKLELLEDGVEDFEILLEFMLQGSVPDVIHTRGTVAAYMDMIAYADKFAMGEAFCELLCDGMITVLENHATKSHHLAMRISPADIQLIFRLTRAGSPLRALLAKDVLSYTGIKGNDQIFLDVEKEIPEFALEMLQQIRLSIPHGSRWIDPFSGKMRKG